MLRRLMIHCVVLLLMVPPAVLADEQGFSPYFALDGADPELDRLPLKSTAVEVQVLGMIADVRVVQQYRNEGSRALEARYVFPASTRAAVHHMQVRIGERVLQAQIREKHKAQAEFQQAKSEGKTAALLTQQRENVLQMNVANILPGDVVDVELRYTELLVPREGVYSFVYPTVVGPRYNGAPGMASHKPLGWTATAHLPEGVPPATGCSLQVELASPTSLTSVVSPTHRIEQQVLGEGRVKVSLADDGRPADNRDFILDYRLAGDALESGVLLSQGAEENFFLALIAPPKRAAASMVVPREYIFVVDISGSMHGFPLDTTKALLRNLIGELQPTDRFNVLLFSGSNTVLAPRPLAASQDNIDKALKLLETRMGSGGTELLPALREAMAMPRDPERSRNLIVVTDGYVTVESDAFRQVRENLGQANLFAFGIGSSVNRALIEGLARAGQGEPFVVLNNQDAQLEAERLRRMIEAPLLTQAQMSFHGLDVYDVEPAALPDLFADRPLLMFGKWRGKPQGYLQAGGLSSQGSFHTEVPIGPAQVLESGQALRHLWARHKVAALMDEENLSRGYAHSQAILDLGLKYGLLTPYTSFVAVDEQVRNPQAAETATVDQPLALPQGVSNQAVGAMVPSTPEPGVWAMLLLAACLGGWMCWRQRDAR